MKIKYEFLSGEVVEVDVPNNIGEISIELDRKIYNRDQTETRRHNSVENMQEQGIQIADESVDVVSIIEKQETNQALDKALDKLLPQQRELIQKVFFEERTMADVAREEGVSSKAIQDRVNKIKARLRKLVKNNFL